MDISIKKLSPVIIDQNISTSKILDLLLTNRNIDLKTKDEYFKPGFPKEEIDMSKAREILAKAIKNNQNILLYGDYDADGITATAVLWQTIIKNYSKVFPFIPNRKNDGYGIKAKTLFRLQKEKKCLYDLIITLDNGIVANREFEQIKASQNCQIMVIDHHFFQTKPKEIDALIHSTAFSASALSWFFSLLIDKTADISLAALGTIADCLPLVQTNRAILIHGLRQLRLNPSPGMRKLIQVSGIKLESISAHDLAFIIAPRINAAGRLSDPNNALRLLCSRNQIEASRYAELLTSDNQKRQQLQEYSQEIANDLVKEEEKVIFIHQPLFNPGIIGLLASRLTEKYYLPSIIIANDNGISKGSCRSIPEINIIEILRQNKNLFIDLGGHPLAAGFSIKPEKIPILKKKIIKAIKILLKNRDLTPTITIDAEMKLSAVNLKNIQAIQKLRPFGIGNPEPLFLFNNLKIVSQKLLGSNKDHLQIKLDDPITPKVEFLATNAIAFKQGYMYQNLKTGGFVDIIASITANTWNGHTSPQLIVKKIISK